MSITRNLQRRKQRRVWRVRNRVRSSAFGRVRLSIFRSNKHIYVQVIDDESGVTIASACTAEAAARERFPNGGNVHAARDVGRVVAERCQAKGVVEVVFDRGAYKYHGRVAAVADGAREAGLLF